MALLRAGTSWLVILSYLVLSSVTLSGCGRIIQPPTPTTAVRPTIIATDTPRATITRRATITPVPATPSDTPTPTLTPTPIIYVIKAGDTLIPIARRFGVSVQEIQEVNGITDPRRLRIGQEIIIPRPEGAHEPTVVPTPTPVALRIQGLAFHRTPTESLWCLGEVVNVSGEPAEEVQVQVSLHNRQGQLLAAAAAFTLLDVLAAGDRAPFAIQFSTPPTSFAQYQARVLSGVAHTHLGPRYPDLKVTDDWGDWVDEYNYRVRGQVRNLGQADAEQVVVVVTLYDEENHVVGARTLDIAADVFLVGAVAPFEVILTPLGTVAEYDVQVQGWWIGYVVPAATGTPLSEGTATP